MNNARRKDIQVQIDALDALVSEVEGLAAKAAEIREAIAALQSDEQESFDNMPEGLQQSDRGQASEQAASDLDDAASSLDEAEQWVDSLNDAKSKLEEILDA